MLISDDALSVSDSLVVTFTPEGMKIATADSSLAARTIASERVISRRSERRTEQSKAIDSSKVA
jgi:hypothetical protein